ncbi:MAG: response regulator transcription factor [Gammaproteobacteria bacterium]|nr:response regulator transcription factor [Gammaproteobacteria bacterium]
MSRQILVIEDNTDISNLLTMHLRDLGCDVRHTGNGREGLELAIQGEYELIILDLMLPGLDGIEICKQLRGKNIYTPILMLTARSSELDRVLGLEVGADDYLTKPFSIRELIARVKAMFRRMENFHREQESESQLIQYKDMRIDLADRVVEVRGRYIDLTAKEFDLLVQFAAQPGRVYTRAQLLDSVWGYGHDGYEHTVNSHINRLRSKIEQDPTHPEFILTVWGVGYKFNRDLQAVA